MKFGMPPFNPRPSPKERIRAGENGIRRKPKFPDEGKKSMGWIQNPAKTTYNKIY